MNTTKTFPNLGFGILGGGQLARMLALSAHDLGVEVHILSENAGDPAAQVVRHWHQGSPNKAKDLQKFLKHVDVATFESEFLDADLLAREAKKAKVQIFPDPELMAELQDRLSQKKILLSYRLPTAEFIEVDFQSRRKDEFTLRDALNTWGGVVLKKRRFGYDGYGTFVVRTQNELEALLPRLKSEVTGFIAERLIPFEREIAIVMTRSLDGSVASFPFVETFQKDSRCLWVKGPVKIKGIEKTQRKLQKFLREIDYVGTMGFELFENKNGSLLINELAPRVHNSGHYSIEAASQSQFTLHVKAVFAQKLAQPRLNAKAFAMFNLLGTSSQASSWPIRIAGRPAGVFVHWYQKTETRAGRKMGHLTTLAATPDKALATLKKARKQFSV